MKKTIETLTRLTTLRALCAALALALATAGTAGLSGAPALAQTVTDKQDLSYSERQVKTFAKASLEVDKLADKWRPAIEAAADQKAADEVRQEAVSEMMVAIRQEGMEPSTYDAIYEAAQKNPALLQSIRQHRANLSGEG